VPTKIFEFEKQTETDIGSLRRVVGIFQSALRDRENFEEFKKKALDEIKDYGSMRFYVGSARQAIESGTDEFASEDGVPRD
jgi:hypothetical protein